ncbi:MAG: TylF/MycF/NovP-related O-methyltransferase [Pseudomonadota bacterium]
MAEVFTLQEVLSDADAYLAVGDVRQAIDVLFEGWDQFDSGGTDEAVDAIRLALGRICHGFWIKRDFDSGRKFTAIVVNAALDRARQTVEPEFLALYAQAAAATGTSPFPLQRIFRHRNLVRLFRRVCAKVVGDVAECGCARGLSFLQLCMSFKPDHPDWTGEGFHVFDSFEGLSEPSEKDIGLDASGPDAALIAANMAPGRFAVPFELVRDNIHRHFPRVALHPGWIPSAFPAVAGRAFCFVHLDVDLYQPTLDSLVYLFPRLAEGGAIITDDYNWPGARAAFDEFCAAHRLHLHTTDTSQAFVLKDSI